MGLILNVCCRCRCRCQCWWGRVYCVVGCSLPIYSTRMYCSYVILKRACPCIQTGSFGSLEPPRAHFAPSSSGNNQEASRQPSDQASVPVLRNDAQVPSSPFSRSIHLPSTGVNSQGEYLNVSTHPHHTTQNPPWASTFCFNCLAHELTNGPALAKIPQQIIQLSKFKF